MNNYHDKRIEQGDFVVRDLLVLFNYRLRLFSRKLKLKWTGSFLCKQVFQHGAVELKNSDGTRFKVNKQSIKLYLGITKCSKK